MKIAIFTDTYKPEINGIVTSVVQFSEILADEGHEVLIFCPKYKKNDIDPDHKNIKVKRYYSVSFVNYKQQRVSLPSLVSMIKDLRSFSPDVVHIQTPLILGIVSLLAVKILRLKNIQTYHSYIPDFMIYLKPKTLPGIKNYIGQKKGLGNIKKALRSEMVVEDRGKNQYIGLKLVDKVGDLSEEIKKGDTQMTDKVAWELTRRVYNKANLVLTPSNALKKELVKNGVKRRVEVLSNGIDLEYFKKKDNYSPKSKLIHVGRIGFEKNIDVVIRAIKIVERKVPGIKLDIMGDGPAKKTLEKMVSDMGLSKNVKFWGFVPRENLQHLYSEYDAFVTASTMETQGLVILEAMSVGLPILGVDKLAVPDIVEHNVNGYISKPFDEKGLAGNILRLYQDPSRLEAFGKESIDLAQKHDVKSCAKKLIKIYEKLSGRSEDARTQTVKVK